MIMTFPKFVFLNAMKMKKTIILLCLLFSISAINSQYRYLANGFSVSAGRQGLTYLAGLEYNVSFARPKEHKTPLLTYSAGLAYYNKLGDVYSLVNNLEWMIADLEFGWKPGGLWYNGSYFIPLLRMESAYISNFKTSQFEVNPAIGLSWQYFLQVRFSYLIYKERESQLIPGKYRVSVSFSPYLLGKFFYNKEWLKGS
jgi:hypothetical protein